MASDRQAPEGAPDGNLQYLDLLLEDRRSGSNAGGEFDRYVHWGYWDRPASATGTRSDFLAAMERLNGVVLDAANLRDGQRILDVGCGFGGTLGAIDRRLEDTRLTGINIDVRQLEVAQANARPTRRNSIRFVAGDACRLPFPDACFDRLIALEAAFHFPSRRQFLDEAARVLTHGGQLVLTDFVPQIASAGVLGRIVQRMLASSYGRVAVSWPEGRYGKMGKLAGLRRFRNDDLTRNTLPTYSYVRKLWRRVDSGRAGRELARATAILYWLARLGIVRYRMLALRRERPRPAGMRGEVLA